MAQKSTQLVNGDVSHSAFVDHIYSYPVVSASYDTYKSNPLGAHTLTLLNRTYERLVYPVLASAFAQDHIKPTVSPYLSKADGLADSSLSTIDAHFPFVKSKPEEIQNLVVGLVKFPFVVVDKERQYVVGVFDEQYKKMGGSPKSGLNVVAASKALFCTGLIATSHTLSTVASWLTEKKQAAEKEVKAKVDSQ